ncbi:hypothetical protein PINS_up010355 [Pythium insidiosum]|nr:hypothetical protein PINS_up010355 [Pythium insidiosum]
MDRRPSLEYTSGKALMARGPEVLHEHVSTRLQAALGRALPQMEVRVHNLSISAEVSVSSENEHQQELPTLANELLRGFRGASAKKTVTKHVLRNVNAVFRPGTMTLLLGQPGSGKSSLMKMLSGRFPVAKNVTIDGAVSYNGTPRHELQQRLPQCVAYVTQRDHHFPTLTVKETLEFAHECCGGHLPRPAADLFDKGTAEENRQGLEAARAMLKHLPEVTIQQLGLENCQDTVVGDSMLRGVSGGERKRVTTGEMQFGNNFVLCLDEISTGLDSAATFDIIKTQRSLARKFQKTIIIALLQPSPEVLALFDDVLIMNDGYVMYHGPRDQAQSYFEALGFACPPRRDVADFLLDLGTRQQAPYEVPRPDGASPPRSPRDFAETFERSALHHAMLQALNAPVAPELANDNDEIFHRLPIFHQSFWDNTKTVTRRQFRLAMRDTAFLGSRAVMVIVMGLVYATLFWQMNPTDLQLVMGLLFTAVLFLAFGQASLISSYITTRTIFYKQRGANFFRTASYVIACTLSQVPIAVSETIVFGTLIYWMCGLVSSWSAFLIFEGLLLCTSLCFGAFFFMLAAASPNLNVAQPVSMVIIVFTIMFAGFVINKEQIPDYLIWVYWINPVSWSLRAMAVNQYSASEFDVDVYHGVDYKAKYGLPMGRASLSLVSVNHEREWIAYGFIYMMVTYAVCVLSSFLLLEYKRYESPENVTIGASDELDQAIAGDHKSLIHVDSSSDDNNFALVTTPNASSDDVILELQPTRRAVGRNFVPVSLAFKDLWYSVPDPANPKESIDLLKGISGFAMPGTITALMGSSGAGKTTLMDVIAGRKTGGKIRGQILLNGHEATDLAIQRCTGYCEQMDIHSEASTIREALTFSAFLRQGSDIPDSQKYDSVDECLELLDMHSIADQIIRGSSVEQMKRLTIGVELAAQPSVLFLDEPTSGLDARSAKMIMDGVRKVADTGRTVVCTIHQPSSEVFMVFDSLLLLKRGGETVFFGDLGKNASQLIKYFESVPGVAPIEDGYNPATWMLEVIGAGVGNTNAQDKDFVATFNASANKANLERDLARHGVGVPEPGSSPIAFKSKRAASESVQCKFLVKRFFDTYWRTPTYNLTRFMTSIILGVLFGFSFNGIKYDTYQGINAGEGMVFMTSVFAGIVSFNGVLPVASLDRSAFYRERASQTYNALWYFVGGTLAEIPYIFGSTFFFIAILFPLVGFTGVLRFFLYWIHSSLLVLLQTYLGMLLVYATPNVEVAAIVGVLINSLSFLFVGYNPPASTIPAGYKWLSYVVPQKYSLSILTALVFCDCPSPDSSNVGCKPLRQAPPTLPAGLTVKQYVESVFEMKHDEIWMNFWIVIAFLVVLRLMAALALRYMNHQKR